jgi:hypothetical protein
VISPLSGNGFHAELFVTSRYLYGSLGSWVVKAPCALNWSDVGGVGAVWQNTLFVFGMQIDADVTGEHCGVGVGVGVLVAPLVGVGVGVGVGGAPEQTKTAKSEVGMIVGVTLLLPPPPQLRSNAEASPASTGTIIKHRRHDFIARQAMTAAHRHVKGGRRAVINGTAGAPDGADWRRWGAPSERSKSDRLLRFLICAGAAN